MPAITMVDLIFTNVNRILRLNCSTSKCFIWFTVCTNDNHCPAGQSCFGNKCVAYDAKGNINQEIPNSK